MYEIRPETVKTFILDRNIKLPRFQRKKPGMKRRILSFVSAYLKNIPWVLQS